MGNKVFEGEATSAAASLKRTVRLLLLEDQVLDAELCERELKRGGVIFSTHRVDTRAAFESALDASTPDLIISDFSLPDSFDGLAALEIAQRKAPETPFVFVSGTIGEERAVEAMKRGATDYVLKDRLNRLIPVIARALQEVEERAARRRAEDQIARLSRFRAVVSGINSAIVRVNDRRQLLEDACRIAVGEGQFLLAWVGVLDPATLDIRPLVSCGRGAELVGGLRLSARENAPGSRGTTATAARTRKPVVVNDIAGDSRVPSKDSALAQGFRALVALPLVMGSEMYGVLKLYAAETGVFDQEEMKLLEEVAGNISFALDRLDKAARVDYLAYYDSLTELPNRTLFADRLTHAVSNARQNRTAIAVVVADIKRFRRINETLGRPAGDALLREVARRIGAEWPDPRNTARISADCFAAFTEVQDASQVAHLLAQLAKSIEAPLSLSATELAVAVTFGISVYPGDGDGPDALVGNAESALNRAKTAAEPYLFYQQEMSARVSEALHLENKLRRAVEREQFVLHYQPKIEIASGRLSSVEALIRWNDPDTGLVPPARFIPVLEETGMILEAGRWAIQKALEDRRAWQLHGQRPLRVAVNVSPRQLRQKDFVATVREAIRHAGTEPLGLELEITESVIMENIEDNIAKLRELRDMGVTIAIDDFGTGYSSLAYLAKLPVDALKIDRSFTITMVNESDSMSIVSTIISLAHALNLKVVAEGVESEEQARFLKLLKCNEAQGYLFSKPLPAEQLEELLASAAR